MGCFSYICVFICSHEHFLIDVGLIVLVFLARCSLFIFSDASNNVSRSCQVNDHNVMRKICVAGGSDEYDCVFQLTF